MVSLFASAIRSTLWGSLLKSLNNTSVEYEIVFAGNSKMDWYYGDGHLRYIQTENIKPAQCYEIARRHCTGEVIVWCADDAEFSNNVIGKAYEYWKLCNNDKLILSLQTKETGYQNIKGTLFDMNIHRFFGGDPNTPLMAPIAMMSRKFLDELGGLDRRYVCGQYENDIVMRAYAQGAKVEIFGGADCYVDIDHLGKSISIGECTNDSDFRDRPFATGYEHDRKILQDSWCVLNQQKIHALRLAGVRSIMPSQIYDISSTQLDTFEPYAKEISLTESESHTGKWK